MWGADAQTDAWPGYALEKASILNAFHSVPNLIVLSGDRHEFAHIAYTSPADYQHNVHEISTSPMSMFYIPIIRTLKSESLEKVNKTKAIVLSGGDGEWIEDIDVEVPKEEVQKYIAKGNYKW